VKLVLHNLEEFCEELPEVTNYKILENRKFPKDGLFSQQIFGPIKSYHCACSKGSFKGSRYGKEKCPKCDVEITTRSLRKERYAKICLPFPVLNPIFYYFITTNKNSSKKIIDDLIFYRHIYWRENKKESFVKLKIDEKTPSVGESLTGLDGAITYIKEIIEDSDKKEYLYIKKNFDQIKLNKVIVIPPEFRPCGKMKNDKYLADDINFQYSKLIKICKEVKSTPISFSLDNDLYKNNYKYIQSIVLKLYDYVLERMSKKTGLIRNNILGKRVDFSGRAVISPNPELSIDECAVPYWMILEILKPNLIAYLVNRHVCKRYNQASKIIDDCIKEKDTKLFKIVEDYCKNKICVLNRQPTLHRMSVLAFKMKIHLGKTIQIPPLITTPYNADFDGDTMAIYLPITDESIEDVSEKISVKNNLISPTDLEITPSPNQDVILGTFAVTKN
jgi:DNA-directed RNA polymerase subunit beta'